MEKDSKTTVAVERTTFAKLDRLAKANSVSKMEYITHAINYFEKYGINPVEHESPAQEMQKLIKRMDQVFAFLNKEDIEYYGKIHFERKGADRYDMHAHIIVSRKDRSNTRKLSPKTNHTGKKNCGNVKGGFDRTDFFRKCETSFDKRTGYDRAPEQTFDYLNTMKNGSPKEIFQKKEWAERVNHERLEKMKAEWSRDLQEPRQEQGREEIQQQGNSISQVPEINQAPQRKKQQEEELDQPRKRIRGFGMGM